MSRYDIDCEVKFTFDNPLGPASVPRAVVAKALSDLVAGSGDVPLADPHRVGQRDGVISRTKATLRHFPTTSFTRLVCWFVT